MEVSRGVSMVWKAARNSIQKFHRGRGKEELIKSTSNRVQGLGPTENLEPFPSKGLVYLPTWMVGFDE